MEENLTLPEQDVEVVDIQFRPGQKIYYFDPCGFDLETGMHAIVETARGVEMGTVLIPPKDVEDDKVIQPLKPVIRIATDEDEKIVEKNKETASSEYARGDSFGLHKNLSLYNSYRIGRLGAKPELGSIFINLED